MGSWLPSIFRSVDNALEPKPISTAVTPVAAAPVRSSVERARLVLAVDATASRAPAWQASQRVMGGLFTALPGELDVALAVHGGGRVHTFTGFTSNMDGLRKQTARVRIRAGHTALLPYPCRGAEA